MADKNQYIKLPDGSYASFPNDMADDKIAEALKQYHAAQPSAIAASTPTAAPAQPGIVGKLWNRANEGLLSTGTVQDIEKSIAIDPQTTQMLREQGKAGGIFGQAGENFAEKYMGGFTPEVVARAALETLNQYYSPVTMALTKLGAAAAKPGASTLTRIAAPGVAIPLAGQQVYQTQQDWGKMSPAERTAAIMGITGGILTGGIGIAAHSGLIGKNKAASGGDQPSNTIPPEIAPAPPKSAVIPATEVPSSSTATSPITLEEIEAANLPVHNSAQESFRTGRALTPEEEKYIDLVRNRNTQIQGMTPIEASKLSNREQSVWMRTRIDAGGNGYTPDRANDLTDVSQLKWLQGDKEGARNLLSRTQFYNTDAEGLSPEDVAKLEAKNQALRDHIAVLKSVYDELEAHPERYPNSPLAAPATQGPKLPEQAFAEKASAHTSVDHPISTPSVAKPQAAGDEAIATKPPSTVQESTSVVPPIRPTTDFNALDDHYLGTAMGKRDAAKGYRDEALFSADTGMGKAYKQAWESADAVRHMAAELSEEPMALSPNRSQPEITPAPPQEGLSALSQEQQDIAANAIKRIQTKASAGVPPEEQAFRQMVESAGGRWNGMDGVNAHYDLPPAMVGGREHVSVASPIDKMSPDFVRSEFARKANELAAPTTLREPTSPQQPTATVPTSLDIPPQISQIFNRITRYSADIQNATNDAARLEAYNQRAWLIRQAGDMVRDHINSLPPDQLPALRDYVNKIADTNSKQAKFITDAVQAHNQGAQARREFVEMRKVGYTAAAKGSDNGELEGLSVERQAETAPLSRSIMDQLQGKQPRVKLDDLVIRQTPKGMTDEQWGTFAQKLKERIQAEHDSILRDAQTIINTGGSIKNSELPGRMRELDRDVRMLGKFPAAPASPGARPPAETRGSKIAPAQAITQADASRMLGRKVNKIPEMNEFTQRADQLNELAQLHKSISAAIDTKIGLKPVPRQAERGAVGEGVTERPIVGGEEVAPAKLLELAKELGISAWAPTTNEPAGPYGWLSEDGKAFIQLPSPSSPGYNKAKSTHAGIAETLLPALTSTLHDTASTAMLQHGWIRKVLPNEYEAHTLSDTQMSTMEMDMIRAGTHGQPMIIDTKDANGRIRALRLDAGWGEKYDSLAAAIQAEKARLRFPQQAGKVSGTEIMGGMATGMAIGGATHGPVGAFVGGVLGASTPAILRSPAIANAIRWTRGIRNINNISLRDWFTTVQDDFTLSPEMSAIRQQQIQSLKAPEAQLAYRVRMAGNIWKMLDPFALITDRPNPVQQWTMAQDPTGKGFRDMKGQLKLDESPYVAVRMAQSGIRGGVGVARQMIGAIENDAQKAGLHEATTSYLNLIQYKRAYQVVDEHMQALRKETQELKQQLALEDDVVKQVGLYKRIEANTEALKDMGDRYRSGKIVPGGYTPEKIQQDLTALQQKVTPKQFAQIQGFAKRVFDQTREHLDIAADVKNNFKESIIPKEQYDAYVARGNEYIPLKRILETAADANKQFYGKNSPLYLRQQNIIHQLQGSEKVNVDPWQAAADGNAEIVREQARNRTLGVFLDAAKKSSAIAEYFTKVPLDYKARKGEMVVGHYENGVQQRYAVPDAIGLSLDVSSPQQAQSLLRMVNEGIKTIFKTGTTVASPLWVLTRQLPNIAGRMIATAEGPIDPRLVGKAFKDAFVSTWTHDDAWMEFAKTGIPRNSLMNIMYPEAKIDSYKLGWKGPIGNFAKHPIDAYRQVVDFPGQWAQLTAFNRLRQAGYSPKAAAFKVQTEGPLPDYAQLGKADGTVAAATTFLRADWAHIRSDLALATRENLRGKLAMTMLAIAVPTLALVYHNIQQTDEKGKSLWAQVSNADKERYWIVLHGGKDADGNPLYSKIMGKPDFVQMYGNPMEDAMYKAMGDIFHKNADPRPMTQLIANTASRFIPGHPNFDANNFNGVKGTGAEILGKTGSALWQNITPTVRVPIEARFNVQDQFGNIRPIVPQNEQKMSPQMQGYGATDVSPTAMDVGRTLGISPRQIEHGIRGMGLRNIETLTDPLLGGDWQRSTGLPLTPNQGLNKPGTVTGPTPINQAEITATNKFYSTVQQAIQPYADYQKLKQTNSVAAGQYLQQHPDAVWKGQLATSLAQRLGEINSRQKELENVPMDPQQRAAIAKNIRDVKMNLLKTFQDMLDKPNLKTPSGQSTGNATSQGSVK